MTILNYTVNYIDIALAAVVLICVIVGYARGLFINVINFIRWAVGLLLCFFASENLSSVIYETYVKPRAIESINKNIVTSTNLDEILKNIQEIGNQLPKALSDSVDFAKLNLSGGDLANEILENYFEGILIFLTKAAIFIAIFVLFFLITGIIILVAKKSSKRKEEKRGHKSALKVFDRIMGAVVGILKGAIAVFAITSVLMIILDMYDDTAQMSAFMNEVNTSGLLKLLDDINPFNAITRGVL